jgi:hypothetical protein
MAVFHSTDAIRYLSGKALGDEANVVCPNCGFDYTHVRHVGTLMGGDEGVMAYEGTVTTGVTGNRRSAVEIVFSCENCPKLFALVIQQHKGNNFVEIHSDIPDPSKKSQ